MSMCRRGTISLAFGIPTARHIYRKTCEAISHQVLPCGIKIWVSIYIPHSMILWDMRMELATPHEKALMLIFAEQRPNSAMHF
jgi:hypothetical protein